MGFDNIKNELPEPYGYETKEGDILYSKEEADEYTKVYNSSYEPLWDEDTLIYSWDIKVPTEVGKLIIESKSDNYSLLAVMGMIYAATDMGSFQDPTTNWIIDNSETFSEAWIHGWISKEDENE